MELSTLTLESLQIAGENAHISDKVFPIFLDLIYRSILDPEKRDVIQSAPSLSGIDAGILKQAYAGVATLLLEAAKQDRGEDTLSDLLEDCKFSQERINCFNKMYKENKEYLRILLSSTGVNPPHIVDVDWRLDYCIKNNHLDKVNQSSYLINLKTEECGGGEGSVQFACSPDQLQDLVSRLRDACKSVERAAQV